MVVTPDYAADSLERHAVLGQDFVDVFLDCAFEGRQAFHSLRRQILLPVLVETEIEEEGVVFAFELGAVVLDEETVAGCDQVIEEVVGLHKGRGRSDNMAGRVDDGDGDGVVGIGDVELGGGLGLGHCACSSGEA